MSKGNLRFVGILFLTLVPMLLRGNGISAAFAEEKRDLRIEYGAGSADSKQGTAPENISQKPEIFVQLGHTWSPNSVALSPDGKYLITENKRDKNLKLWDVKSGREIRTFYHSEDVSPLSGDTSFSPDGNYVLSLPDYYTVKIWDIRTGKEFRTFKDDKTMFTSAYFSYDGKSVLTGGAFTKEWDIETGKETSIPDLTFLGYSPNEKDILIIGFFEDVFFIKRQKGKREKIQIDNSDKVWSAKFSPDGRYILAKILKHYCPNVEKDKCSNI